MLAEWCRFLLKEGGGGGGGCKTIPPTAKSMYTTFFSLIISARHVYINAHTCLAEITNSMEKKKGFNVI